MGRSHVNTLRLQSLALIRAGSSDLFREGFAPAANFCTATSSTHPQRFDEPPVNYANWIRERELFPPVV